ncbi:MAG: hypothetical protein LBR11_03030 [Deltaproteobacteria bacterium]|jgi:predicted nuclease with TOPRIM domain|nr:hypothetical protein [Deltaproteobacteria bacterium]
MDYSLQNAIILAKEILANGKQLTAQSLREAIGGGPYSIIIPLLHDVSDYLYPDKANLNINERYSNNFNLLLNEIITHLDEQTGEFNKKFDLYSNIEEELIQEINSLEIEINNLHKTIDNSKNDYEDLNKKYNELVDECYKLQNENKELNNKIDKFYVKIGMLEYLKTENDTLNEKLDKARNDIFELTVANEIYKRKNK